MTSPQAWMPSALTDDEKDAFAEAYPDDPHGAAAAAWESYSATLPIGPTVTGVSTGAQSVSYATGYQEADAAAKRGAWHRARSKTTTVQVGGDYEWGWTADDRVIKVYDAPPHPVMGDTLPEGVLDDPYLYGGLDDDEDDEDGS